MSDIKNHDRVRITLEASEHYGKEGTVTGSREFGSGTDIRVMYFINLDGVGNIQYYSSSIELVETKFATGDRVKITGAIVPSYNGHVGEVSSVGTFNVWVNLPYAGTAVSFPKDQVTKLKDPAKGDRVRVHQKGSRWDQHEGTVESVHDKVVNVLLDADNSSAARLHVKEVEVFDPAPKRVEGAEISFKDVKKGDLIETLSFTEKGGVKKKIYTEAVVDAISLRNDQLRSRKGGVIYDPTIHSGIKLLRSADNDPVLTALNGFKDEAVLSFYESGVQASFKLCVAVKRSSGHWGLLHSGNGGQTINVGTLRDMLIAAGDSYTILDS